MEQLYFFDDENIIGYAFAIKEYLEKENEELVKHFGYDEDDGDILISKELIKELEKHDDLVKCCWHPMGAYYVVDLIERRTSYAS